jgi:hypothetical protein
MFCIGEKKLIKMRFKVDARYLKRDAIEQKYLETVVDEG